jgi:hypothetical protein
VCLSSIRNPRHNNNISRSRFASSYDSCVPTYMFIFIVPGHKPLFASRNPRPAAQSDSILPRVFVLAFPHCEEWALKSPRTSNWQGRHLPTHSSTPSRKSPNAVKPLLLTRSFQPTRPRHSRCHGQAGRRGHSALSFTL